MVSRKVIEHQLHQIGFNPFSWGRTEVRELSNIMMDDEQIVECVNGEYSNGFALVAATNHRVLLVDKKPFLYLTVEDIRFEQISDFNFRNRFLSATVTICTSSRTLHFMSYNKKRLRRLITCVQRRVVELRERGQTQQHMVADQSVPAASQAPAVSAQLIDVAPIDPPAIPAAHPRLTKIATYTRDRLPTLHKPVYADHDKSRDGQEPAQTDVQPANGYQGGSLPQYRYPDLV